LKAIRIHQHGGVEQLHYEETADPEPQSPDDVVVRLKAAAVNLSDIEVRHGITGKRICLPRILGSDGAGVVAAVGNGVNELKIGDRVCLYPQSGCTACWACRSDQPHLCEQPQRLGEHVDGTYAEFLRVHRQNCFLLPQELAFEQGAAIPVAYLSAWRMLVTDADLKPGESLLIRGIDNSIATAALQLAMNLRIHTIVTADSAEKLAKALKLGANHGIDEGSQDFPLEVRRLTGKRGVDVVVDCVGGESWAKSLAALNRDGRLVSCGASAGTQPATDLRRIFWHHLKVLGSSLGSRDELRSVLAYITTSHIRPIIDTIYPLADASQAQQRLAEGDHFGKIVLRIDG
jgi:NADPH:quinone reductase-like Zn-dependent oxidoreductase